MRNWITGLAMVLGLAISLGYCARSVAGECGTCCCDNSNACDSSGCVCDSGCCDCCDDFDDCDRLLGLLPSDHCFDDFISPISNPFFFEDPRSLTEARGIFFANSLPATSNGGDADVWAAQLRGRLSERLSVIAPRLAYLNVNQAGNPTSGLLSAPVGVKYNFVRDVDRQLLVSGGVTFFINGSEDAASAFGDGDFHFFLTGGKQIFDYGHWLSGAGFRIPTNNNFGTQMFYWSNQFDVELPGHVYAVGGVNWFHYMRSSNVNYTGSVGGLDLINLPAGDIAGTDVVTALAGLKWKPSANLELGSGFEFPLTNNTDILRNRFYADVIIRY